MYQKKSQAISLRFTTNEMDDIERCAARAKLTPIKWGEKVLVQIARKITGAAHVSEEPVEPAPAGT